MKKEEFKKLIEDTVKRIADDYFSESDEIDPEYDDQDNADRVWEICIERATDDVYDAPREHIDEDEYEKITDDNWKDFEEILGNITWKTYK